MISEIVAGWTQYWFSPRSSRMLLLPRLGICLFAVLWWASFLPGVASWYGPQGVLNIDVTSKLIDFQEIASWQQWSPLWWFPSIFAHASWLIVGMMLSFVACLGMGGRAVMAVLLLWTIAWTHRISWMEGPVEPLLVACLAYLTIEPGPAVWQLRKNQQHSPHTWTAGLAVALLTTHWWLLIAAGVLSQLASLTWWRGEAVWWLAAAGRSNILSTEMLSGNASLVNGLTHVCVVVQFAALGLISRGSTRSLGIGLGLVVSVVYGLIADQILYALLLTAVLSAFIALLAKRQLPISGAMPVRA